MTASGDNALIWYGLFCVKGLGPKRLHVIYEATRDSQLAIDELFQMNADRFREVLPGLSQSVFEAVQALDWERTEEEHRRLMEQEIKVIHLGHAEYPEKLIQRMETSAPALLFCRGNTRLLKSEGVAIVGSRNASEKGLQLAGQLAGELAGRGKNVISGYAKGVDTNAHQGALKREGTTTIVLSTGILEFSAKKAFEDVHWERDVLVVSQFRPRDKWRAGNAMIRNSLVCALSAAVLVIEAGKERDEEGKMSGTFAAGKTALEMGVPLLVLDPEVLEKPPPGNRHLIAAGGASIRPGEGVDSILEYLRQPVAPAKQGERAQTLFD